MKKVFYLVLVLFSMSACQKEDSISTEIDNPTVVDLNSEIGAWHNIAVDLYMNNNNKSAGINYEEVQNVIIQELTTNYPSVFNAGSIEQMKNDSEALLEEILQSSNSGKSGITKETLVYNTSLVLDFIGEKGYINQKLANELVQIATSIETSSISEKDVLIKIEALEDFIINDQDKKFVNAFKQVFYASKEYWSNNSNSKGNVGIIWADAAGALYGMLLGPVGSIIEGAVFSTIAAIQ